MGPELKDNKEFSRWFDQWVARIQSNSLHDHEPPKGGADLNEEDEGRREAEKEPVLRH